MQNNITELNVFAYTGTIGAWDDNNTALRFYNPGLYINTKPTEWNQCPGTLSLSSCTSYGWKEYAPGDDEHYLIGNLYSFAAATVGSNITSNNATGSVCPTHWKLPLGGSNQSNGSFHNLLNKYGLTSEISNDSYNITGAPLYFLRSGYIGFNFNLLDAGSVGMYWSRTTTDNTKAYMLYIPNAVNFTEGARYVGRSVRCVATSS